MAVRMSAREFQKLSSALSDNERKESKFHNRKVKDGAKIFDSQGEYERYKYLCILEKAGDITDLTFHEEQLVLLHNPCIKYIPDFCYVENGVKILEDFKGVQTKEFIIKKKMIAAMIRRGAEFAFRIVRKNGADSYEAYEEYFPSGEPHKHQWRQVSNGVKWCFVCGALCDGKSVHIPESIRFSEGMHIPEEE